MKKKLYQKPNIKVHELPKDALLAASAVPSLENEKPYVSTTNTIAGNPTGDESSSMPTINSKRGNLWGDDEE